MLAPDRIECCTRDLLKRTAEARAELACPVRLHCCQSELEVETVDQRFGASSLQVLDNLGFLGPMVLLPHAWFLGGADPTPEGIGRDVDMLARSGSTIVHCPIVGARHGLFMDSFAKFRRRGINIGTGTDTYPPDMVGNLHVGLMFTRIVENSQEACTAADYYTAATIGGADAIGRSDLGRLCPGARADITVFDLNGFHMGQVVDPIQTMILNGTGRDFTTVIVDGRTVVENRAVRGMDFAACHERAQRQYDKLRASYPERSHRHPPVEEIFKPSFPVLTAPQRKA